MVTGGTSIRFTGAAVREASVFLICWRRHSLQTPTPGWVPHAASAVPFPIRRRKSRSPRAAPSGDVLEFAGFDHRDCAIRKRSEAAGHNRRRRRIMCGQRIGIEKCRGRFARYLLRYRNFLRRTQRRPNNPAPRMLRLAGSGTEAEAEAADQSPVKAPSSPALVRKMLTK